MEKHTATTPATVAERLSAVLKKEHPIKSGATNRPTNAITIHIANTIGGYAMFSFFFPLCSAAAV